MCDWSTLLHDYKTRDKILYSILTCIITFRKCNANVYPRKSSEDGACCIISMSRLPCHLCLLLTSSRSHVLAFFYRLIKNSNKSTLRNCGSTLDQSNKKQNECNYICIYSFYQIRMYIYISVLIRPWSYVQYMNVCLSSLRSNHQIKC